MHFPDSSGQQISQHLVNKQLTTTPAKKDPIKKVGSQALSQSASPQKPTGVSKVEKPKAKERPTCLASQKTHDIGPALLDKSKSPVEKQLSKWLRAINSCKPDQLKKVMDQFGKPTEELRDFFEFLQDRTQGYNLIKVVVSSPTDMKVILQEQCAFQEYALLTVKVEANPPHRIIDFGLNETDIETVPVERMPEVEALQAIESHITQLAEQGKFSGTVLITKEGNETALLSRAVGLTNIEDETDNTIDTKFNLGSMVKMFTSVAILQLVEEGKVKLDDPIGKHLTTDIEKELAEVTVRQLLTHTGGTGNAVGPEVEAAMTPKEIMRICKARKPEFPPGSDWKYSNYGFVLLGAIIETVDEPKDYYQSIQARVFNKANMSHSGFYLKTENTPQLATGYIRKKDGLKNNFDTLPIRGTPAGGGYSNAVDLNKFAHAILEEQVITTKSADLISTPTKVAPHGATWTLGFMDGDLWFGHEGKMDGVNSALRIYPIAGYVVAVLGNLDPPAASDLAEFIGARLPDT